MAFRLRNLFAGRSQQKGYSAKLHEAHLLTELGRLELAAQVLRELLATDAGDAEAWYRQGNVLKDLHQPIDAITSYDRAIDLRPHFAAAYCNRGVVLLALGKSAEALSDFRAAVEINPSDAIAHHNSATAHHRLNQTASALDGYSKALDLNPDYAEAYFSRGLLFEESLRWQEALNDYDHALAINPGFSQAHFHRGNVLVQLTRWDDALTSYDQAVTCDPKYVLAHLHRGNVLRQLHMWDAALTSYNRAISLNPDQIDGYYNRGVLFEQLKRFPEAEASFNLAISINPDFAPAQYNRALVLLSTGDLVRGFENYEWRWKNRGASLDPAKYHGMEPLWLGHESLEKKSILVFSEQGLGDTLQFCRYVKLLAMLGAKVVLEVQQPLAELLADIDGAAAVIARGAHLQTCDYKCALLSLPLAFKTSLENIPANRKYLRADTARIAQWQTRLGPRARPRIGLAWSGNPQNPNDNQRSIPLATLIKNLPKEFEYHCLQSEIRDHDRACLDENASILKHSLGFMDTAALCECMDLVISVCTSLAHLAGALGRPVWILLAYNADWRWLENRDDSPWYPSARLYRQPTIGDWQGVVARVCQELRRTFKDGGDL